MNQKHGVFSATNNSFRNIGNVKTISSSKQQILYGKREDEILNKLMEQEKLLEA